MKNQKGVTLVSLTIYIIVAGIVFLIVAFLNANFFSRMSELINESKVTNEFSKFCSVFIRDVKNSESITEYNDKQLKFSNGAVYEVRKLENTEATYAIYRNSVKICESLKGKYIQILKNVGEEDEQEADWKLTPYFDYDYMENRVTTFLNFGNPKVDKGYEFEFQQTFKVGKGYE